MGKRAVWATRLLVAGALVLGGVQVIAHSLRAAPAAPTLAYDLPPLPSFAPTARVVPAAAPADTRFVLKRVLTLDRPLRHGDWVWNEAGAPDGPLVITVDLAAQVLSAFRDGYEIGTAAIIYGADEKPTPLGAFPISQKDAHHVSNLYDAPMPYMLRLTNDGVTIHGSDHVRADAATHGCVGVPVAFARKLFGAAKLGDIVIVTNGRTIQVGDRIVRS